MWSPTQHLGPIGSAVLTFIGYKQINKQTFRHPDKQSSECSIASYQQEMTTFEINKNMNI